MTQHRSLHVIAREIYQTWPNISPYALPYLEAMGYLDRITDVYGAEVGYDIVRYFLSNAAGWRGEDARRIKLELRGMVGLKPTTH